MLVLLFSVLAAGSPPENQTPRDWLIRRNGVLELALAHQESDGADGGILTVDSNRRMVMWQGIQSDVGCKERVEARFEDVKSVKAQEGAGFVIEFVKSVGKKIVLLPRPHAQWFQRQYRSPEAGGLSQFIAERRTGDAEGGMRIGGVRGGAGPTLRRVELPPQVRVDTRAAMAAVLDALDRGPAPGEVLRETLHGDPEDVPLTDLLQNPLPYEGHAVRITARLNNASSGGEFVLVVDGKKLLLSPTTEAAQVLAQRSQEWSGQEIEATGVFAQRLDPSSGDPVPTLRVWKYARSGEAQQGDMFSARVVTLKDLTTTPAPSGEMVRVVARFRGRNLHKDLPGKPPQTDAWVVKQGAHAAWVLGMPPRGKGWRLDPGSLADTRHWLEIVAKTEMREGVLQLTAVRVAPAEPPGTAWMKAGKRLLTAMASPQLVFALPLDGAEEIRPDSRFVFQFSQYMDEESFQGRVELRYAGREGDGEARFEGVRLSYDETKRALVVDPGQPLEPGREVECVLLPGIADVDGQPLVARPGKEREGAIEVLRYHVGS